MLGGAAFAYSWPLRAQQNMPRIGVLILGGPVEAKNSYRSPLCLLEWATSMDATLPLKFARPMATSVESQLAHELVATNPTVLVSASTVAAQALAAVTRDIPIVVTVTVDPVAAGLSDSMARPSRNVTGFTSSARSCGEAPRTAAPADSGLAPRGVYERACRTAYEIFDQHIRAAAPHSVLPLS